MRKSCAYVVQICEQPCGRIHALFAFCTHFYGRLADPGYLSATFPRLLRTQTLRFYTANIAHFIPVNWILFPTIHMTNNNYNSVYISI
jgi:hypothetical protein